MKRYILTGCGVIVLVIIIWAAYVLIFDNEKDKFDFEKDRVKMEKVASEIVQGRYDITENGLVELPEEYENLSDTGDVSLVMFDGKAAVYFWTYRGMLESSKGYVYVFDNATEDVIDKCSSSNNFVNVKEVTTNWYSVSTD